MPVTQKFKRLISDPKVVLDRLYSKVLSPFLPDEFSGATGNRSVSEVNGKYLSAVMKALNNYSAFSNFKRHPYYQGVLEHVSESQGADYLSVISRQTPQFLHESILSKILENDDIGNPIKYSYRDVGPISPTTLRYLKVASDLKHYFGDDLGQDVVEIGCGYGGQCRILDQLFDIKRYQLFDLPLVNQLISKYLESYIMRGSYCTSTINTYEPKPIDLVISNYAFSELPRNIQESYIEKVLSKSAKGYLSMNERSNMVKTKGFLSPPYQLEDFRSRLPTFEVIEEIPLTGPGNYIIIWGHQ
jgi:hypothetical protein